MTNMKVLHAPMNFANQPMLIVECLKKRGIEAEHILYSNVEKNRFGYRTDKVVSLKASEAKKHHEDMPFRLQGQLNTLQYCLEKGFNIYHFWQRSLLFSSDFSMMSGLDVPLIKARGAKMIHRFTGFDLRLPTQDMQLNPYSPYRHGFTPPFDEVKQLSYFDFLRNYIDQFLVQDPELLQFWPDAKVIPRGLDLTEWPYQELRKNDSPLVIHAPSNGIYKGSKYVNRAIETLKEEGLKFRYRQISDMSHEEAKKVYQEADIIVDQLLIGSTGVLTLEAWALGKPVVLYLREDLFRPFYGCMPAANANPDNITSVLRDLIKDFDWRSELSKTGRRIVEDHHDINKVTDQCEALYKELLQKSQKYAVDTKDIEYVRDRFGEVKYPQRAKQAIETVILMAPRPIFNILYKNRILLRHYYGGIKRRIQWTRNRVLWACSKVKTIAKNM